MPLLTAEAEKLSLDDLRAGIVEEIVTTDELYSIMPFRPVGGKAYLYNREATLSEADFVDVGDTITEGAATFNPITQKLKRLVGDVDVDDFLDETMSDQNDQTATQISKKTKGIARKFARTMINGNETTNPKEFNGLLQLCVTAQKIEAGANGAALSFAQLDALLDLLKTPGQKAIVMNSRTLRSYNTLCRALGGTTPEHINWPGVVGPIPAYRGFPILKNDYVPTNQVQGGSGAVCTTVFGAVLNEEEGLCGIHTRKNMGIHYKLIGTVQNKDATRHRLRWYAALALHSTLALAQIYGVNN